jgi:hypothetical protein
MHVLNVRSGQSHGATKAPQNKVWALTCFFERTAKARQRREAPMTLHVGASDNNGLKSPCAQAPRLRESKPKTKKRSLNPTTFSVLKAHCPQAPPFVGDWPRQPRRYALSPPFLF